MFGAFGKCFNSVRKLVLPVLHRAVNKHNLRTKSYRDKQKILGKLNSKIRDFSTVVESTPPE